MADDCWGDSSRNDPYCPTCGYNVIGYEWLRHVKREHNGINPRKADRG